MRLDLSKKDKARLGRVLRRAEDTAADLEEMGFLDEGSRIRESIRYLQQDLKLAVIR